MLNFLVGIGLSFGSSLLGSLFGGGRKAVTQREVNLLETHDEPSSRYGDPIPLLYGKVRAQGIYIAAKVPFDWERDDYYNPTTGEWVLTYIYYGDCGVMWGQLPTYNNGPAITEVWMNRQLYCQAGIYSDILGVYWGQFEGLSYTDNFDRTTLDPRLDFLGELHTSFRRAIYTSYNRLRLNNSDGGLFDYRYPNMEAVVNTFAGGSPPKLGLIIKDLLLEAGYLEEQIDATELDTTEVRGYLCLGGRLEDKLGTLQAAYFFEIVDTGAKLKFIRSYRSASSAYIPATALSAREASASQGFLFEETEVDLTELPSSVRILYNDALDWYEPATTESFKLDLAKVDNVQEINTGLSLTPTEALTIANRQLLVQWSRRKRYKFAVLSRFNFLEAGDVVDVELRGASTTQVQITRINTQPSGVIQIEAHSYDPLVWGLGWTVAATYSTTATATQGVPISTGQEDITVITVTNADGTVTYTEGDDYTVDSANGTVTPVPGGDIDNGTEVVINWQGEGEEPTPPDTTSPLTSLAAVECHLPSDQDTVGVYVFADAPDPWQSATLWISRAGGPYVSSGTIQRGVSGTCSTTLPNGSGVDNINSLTVVISSTMTLPSTGRVLVGNEILDYSTATLDSSTATTKTYTLSTFVRALRRTSGTGHLANEKLYLLSGYKYTCTLTTADIGTTISFKAVNAGQELADVSATSIVVQGLGFTVLTPRVDDFSPRQGGVGTAITIYGAGFDYAESANVNGVDLDSLAIVSDTEITGAIGIGTTTGKVTVVEDSTLSEQLGDGVSVGDFVVNVALVDWGDIGGTLSDQTDLQSALNGKENTITAGTTSQYWRGDKTWQTLDKAAVGLSNVDNTSDADKPISTATQTALNGKYNNPTGTTSQYIRGDGSLASFNTYGSFFAATPTVKNIPLFTATRATTINELRGVDTSAGTATISIQIGGVNVTGLTNLSVTSTPQNFTATGANTVAIGARVTVNITAVSSAADLEFTMGATLN